MLSELEQACKTYSIESSCGLIGFDSNWQRKFVTALTFHLDRAFFILKELEWFSCVPKVTCGQKHPGLFSDPRKHWWSIFHYRAQDIDFAALKAHFDNCKDIVDDKSGQPMLPSYIDDTKNLTLADAFSGGVPSCPSVDSGSEMGSSSGPDRRKA